MDVAEVVEAVRSSTSDLADSANGVPTVANGLAKSKIPRFKRSQSMRLKGEKFRPPLQPVCLPPSRSSLKLCNLRVIENDDSHSETSETKVHHRRMSLKTAGGSQLCCRTGATKASTPSEYGSLPPTPLPSPDVDDLQSVKSFRSFGSSMSLDAFTTSSLAATLGPRRKKFVVHCPSHNHDEEEYLTPTQRKDRLIRQLKAMLLRNRRELDEKDGEILCLTKEVLELRMFKSDVIVKLDTNASVAAAAAAAATAADTSTVEPCDDLNSVFVSTRDSGHFEGSSDHEACGGSDSLSLVSTSCKDMATNTSVCGEGGNGGKAVNVVVLPTKADSVCHQSDLEAIYRREIDDLKRLHSNEYQEMKEKYNDRIENLLQKLSEANSSYFDLRPKYDRSQERIRHLEAQVQLLEAETKDNNKRHDQMYLKMYKKGQEAARFQHADEVLEFAHKAPKRVSVPEILKQLHMTESELERMKELYRREIYKQSNTTGRESDITLKFLKDAIYYFLTDKDGRDHLKAIESIMGYSESERQSIERSVFSKNKLI